MANKHRGEIEVMLDKKRIFKFGTHALAELEDSLGHAFSAINEQDSKKVKTTVKMVWAALLHESPGITFKEAADLMDYADYEYIGEKIQEAMELQANRHNKEEKKT